jgi:hypothetical protein
MLNVSITHDEALCYKDYITAPYKNIVSLIPVTANNHILNSLLAKTFLSAFGDNLFILRLPSLLALILFLFSAYLLLSRLIQKPIYILAAFLLLNANLFLFDFWGLSRGYGLSIAFMTLSIYGLFSFLQLQKNSHLYLCLGAGVLSVYSNLSALNYFLTLQAVIGITLLVQARQNKTQTIGRFIAITVSCIALYILIAQPLIELRKDDQLYYGGDKGLVADTFYSLIRESLFASDRLNGTFLEGLSWGSLVFIFLSGAFWVYILIRNKTDNKALIGFILWALIALPCFLIELQHLLLGTKYVIDRTALFLYPLFILHLSYLLYYLSYKLVRIAFVFTSFIVLALVINFLVKASISHTRTWEPDKYTPMIMDRVKAESIRRGSKTRMRVYWETLPAIDYYQKKKYSAYILPLEGRFDQPDSAHKYDYYYIHRGDIDWIPAGYSLDTAVNYDKYQLYKRK